MPKVLLKTLLFVLILVIYFMGIRPIRSYVVKKQLDGLMTEKELPEHVILESNTPYNATMIYIIYKHRDFQKDWNYKFPFGMFFLFALLGLVAIAGDKRFYMYLIFVHIAGVILSNIFLYVGLKYSPWLIAITDLLTRYLIPLCSMGMVPLAYLEKRKLSDAGSI